MTRGEGVVRDRGSLPPEASGVYERRGDDAEEGDSGSLGFNEDSGGSSEGDEEDETVAVEADGGGGGSGNQKPVRGGPRPSTVQTPLAVGNPKP